MHREETLAGGLWGLLVGDALGVPYEFHSPDDLATLPEIEMRPPAAFPRAHRGIRPGTWSDDGAQALCLLASLLDRGQLDIEDFGHRLTEWYEHGYMAVDGAVFDVGVQTAEAIANLLQGVSAATAARTDELANGNGSLMRVLPLALWHRGTDSELVADAHRQSLVTHGHARAQACCALYCLWARAMLAESSAPWPWAVSRLRALYADDPIRSRELEVAIQPEVPGAITGTGYVVDCLRSALWAVSQGGYEKAVCAAILLGNDTDTTACVAGGIAGIRDGVEGIPVHWRLALRGQELFAPLLERLIQHHRSR